MLKTIDLFAGAGGLSFGFEETNEFVIVAAAENNSNARETYITNHKEQENITMINDVRGFDFKKLADEKGGIDIVIGGPPCQGFSNANRQKNHLVSMNNSLVKEYFRAVKEISPKAFVMENVAMLASNTHKFYDSYKDHDEIEKLGIPKIKDELVLADGEYNGFRLLDIFESKTEDDYRISEDLYQLLNVLYKNRSNTKRMESFKKKNKKQMIKNIASFKETTKYRIPVLDEVISYLDDSQYDCDFETLNEYIKFQKAFKLKKELDDNEIIYKLEQDPKTNKIKAKVEFYTVGDYVKKVVEEQYNTNSDVLNAIWFGVPQERRRFIFMGIKKELCDKENVKLPTGKPEEIVTVKDAIYDLKNYETVDELAGDTLQKYIKDPDLSKYAKKMRKGAKGVKNHIITKTREQAMERFKALKQGENFHKLSPELKESYSKPERTQNSVYLRLNYSEPSGTVINVRKSMWEHPELDRAVSIREAARLQSFPDRFEFKGTKDSQYQQVGNAVPPLMAEAIAKQLLENLKKGKK